MAIAFNLHWFIERVKQFRPEPQFIGGEAAVHESTE